MPARPPDWPERVERRVRRWAQGAGASWVVAVSGGGDSVALLRVLHAMAPRLGLSLSVAHFDHGVRGEAGRADADVTAELAAALGLPCDVGTWAPARPTHFEADARAARYAWLASVALDRGAVAVAVGHTRDDQAETVLHRVLRGTGPRGLRGIPARRALGQGVTLVRPLLDVARADLRGYLAALGQPYCEDATNADPSRTRARLRHGLLPGLAAGYNPAVADALVRLGRLAGASYRALQREAGRLERRATVRLGPGEVVLDRGPLRDAPGSVRAEALRRAWRRAGWPEGGMTEARWRRLARLARVEGVFPRIDLGAGVWAEPGPEPETMTLRRAVGGEAPSLIPPGPVPLWVPGAAEWPGGRVVVTLDPADPRDETVDLGRAALPLHVRAPAPGDRFEPLGLSGRSQPLNDFFRARRVPPPAREATPLVCDASGAILWVVGHRIADRVKLTDAPARPAGLRWVPRSGG